MHDLFSRWLASFINASDACCVAALDWTQKFYLKHKPPLYACTELDLEKNC
jgi:hypothetical protein